MEKLNYITNEVAGLETATILKAFENKDGFVVLCKAKQNQVIGAHYVTPADGFYIYYNIVGSQEVITTGSTLAEATQYFVNLVATLKIE